MKNILLIGWVAFILASCSNTTSDGLSKEQYQAKIDSLENTRNEFFKSSTIPPKEMVLKSIEAYELYADDYPTDDKSGGFLFEAAKRYEIDLQDFNNAIRLYKKIYDEYESHEHHTMALFHIGNAYHSLNDTTNAIKHFNLFIEKYPNHDFADDAQGMINLSRIGEEEFFKQIMEKSKQKEDSIVG